MNGAGLQINPHVGKKCCYSMTIQSFLSLKFTRTDIRPPVKWAVNLVIADDHFVWVCMGLDTHFISTEDDYHVDCFFEWNLRDSAVCPVCKSMNVFTLVFLYF